MLKSVLLFSHMRFFHIMLLEAVFNQWHDRRNLFYLITCMGLTTMTQVHVALDSIIMNSMIVSQTPLTPKKM